jgi:hypothetical protein
MTDISTKVMRQVEEQKLAPKARWRFLLKDWVFWLAYAAALILGSLATAAAIFILTDFDWSALPLLHRTWFQGALAALPYFWLAALASLTALAYLNFRRTERGYRLRAPLLVLANIIFSLLLGAAFYHAGLGQIMDRNFAGRVPFYRGVEAERRAAWSRPEQGLLSGEIISTETDGIIRLRDWDGKIWTVRVEGAFWRQMAGRGQGDKLKIIGHTDGDTVFEAQDIRPWQGNGRGLQQGRERNLKQLRITG